MIGEITPWIMAVMKTHGALTVFIGVIIESIIVPIPSPLIIMGAGALLIEPGLSLGGAFAPIVTKIVLPGALASTLGAYFAFGIAYVGGKPIIDRMSRFLGFGWGDVELMEVRLKGKFGPMIFFLRAAPIVPLSVISAAAGVLRLPIGGFTFWTLMGSIVRCLLLGYLGYLTRDTYETLAGNLNRIESLVSAGLVVAAFALIFWLRARLKSR